MYIIKILLSDIFQGFFIFIFSTAKYGVNNLLYFKICVNICMYVCIWYVVFITIQLKIPN